MPDLAETRKRLREWAEVVGPSNGVAYSSVLVLNALDVAEAEAADAWALSERQAAILSAVAVALQGPTPALTLWSHHDLAELAIAMKAKLDAAEVALANLSERVERHIREQDRHWRDDYACRECVGPDEEIPPIIEGWKCPRHKALALIRGEGVDRG